MRQNKTIHSIAAILSCVLAMAHFAPATSKLPAKPLRERIGAAEIIAVGKVVNRVASGDWVEAEILVEEPLKNAKKGDRIKVIWRTKIGDRPIYDTGEGTRAIAILKAKHKGRYWLRADKFVDKKKLEQVKKLISYEKAAAERKAKSEAAKKSESKGDKKKQPSTSVPKDTTEK